MLKNRYQRELKISISIREISKKCLSLIKLESLKNKYLEENLKNFKEKEELNANKENEEEEKENEKKIQIPENIIKRLKKWDLLFDNKLSFVGISNWNIDASKMNRNIYLARPDPDIDTLKETGEFIVRSKYDEYNNKTENSRILINKYIKLICESYNKFRETQKVKIN